MNEETFCLTKEKDFKLMTQFDIGDIIEVKSKYCGDREKNVANSNMGRVYIGSMYKKFLCVVKEIYDFFFVIDVINTKGEKLYTSTLHKKDLFNGVKVAKLIQGGILK